NGIVLTRDLFNLFVFLEIAAIASYGILAIEDDENSLAAGFKYVIAGGISSAVLLLGTIFLYRITGTLNIDGMIVWANANAGALAAGAGLSAVFLVIAALLIELKPFPANGWALDVYESAHPAVSAVLSIGTSTAMVAALIKIVPLMPQTVAAVLAGAGVLSFAASNLVGLRQRDARRMLGYSSVAQIGLVVAVISGARLFTDVAPATVALIAGGLLVNHFLAKGGLFWLVGALGIRTIDEARGRLHGAYGLSLLVGLLIIALAGLPPFPAFWAKWQLVVSMMGNGQFLWVALLLGGSLFEATYLFRFFGILRAPAPAATDAGSPAGLPGSIPATLFAVAAIATGIAGAWLFGFRDLLLFLPLGGAALLFVLDGLPGALKGGVSIIVLGAYAYLVAPALSGLTLVFALVLAGGPALLLLAALHRRGRVAGAFPLFVLFALAMSSLLVARSALGFLFGFELMTLSSYLLLQRGERAELPAHRYLVFSLGGAFLLMAGLAMVVSGGGSFAAPGSALQMPFLEHLTTALAPPQVGAALLSVGGSATGALATAGPGAGVASVPAGLAGTAVPTAAVVLILIGFLVKAGAVGVHIWLPSSYGEAEGETSALFSAVLSKVPVFGIVLALLALVGGGFAAASGGAAEAAAGAATWLFPVLGWVGLLTALFGALLAVFQEDVKYLLAYSSMSQIGYIIAAFAAASHLGWSTGLYLSVLHFAFKGILFLAIAGVILRTGTSTFHRLGGLIKKMPISFVTVLIAIISVSGVPPLAGFGGKWLLYTALLEEGLNLQAALAFFASTIAFLYLFKLIHAVFLGQPKDELADVREAPIWLLIPQVALVSGIMVISMYPTIILEPIAAAVSPYIASTVAFDGYTVVSALGYWNGNVVMYVTMGVFILPLVWLLVVMKTPQRVEQFNIVFAAERPERPETTHYAHNFFTPYYRALGFLTRPGVIGFWNGIQEAVSSMGGAVRRIYSGNGQTYALHILLLVAVLYLIAGGM
ncbi:MAG: proton-conducting transporter membrane subunit, partial [Spirochaetia bacterium]